MRNNRVEFTGRATKAYEVRQIRSGEKTTSALDIRLAVQLDKNDKKSGQKKTIFVPVKIYGNEADYLVKYGVPKGRITVFGYYDPDEYEKDGQKVYTHDFVATEVSIIDYKPKEDTAENSSGQGQQMAQNGNYQGGGYQNAGYRNGGYANTGSAVGARQAGARNSSQNTQYNGSQMPAPNPFMGQGYNNQMGNPQPAPMNNAPFGGDFYGGYQTMAPDEEMPFN